MMNCCCTSSAVVGGLASCDPGQSPEECTWRMEIIDAVMDPAGAIGNVIATGTATFSPVFLTIPLADDCVTAEDGLPEPLDAEDIDPITYREFPDGLPSYQDFQSSYTYRCSDIDTKAKADFSFGDESSSVYELEYESTEILEDGSRKWTYALRNYPVLPRNGSFDPGSAFDDFGIFTSYERGIGTAVFTIFEKAQPAENYRDSYPYLEDDTDASVSSAIEPTETQFSSDLDDSKDWVGKTVEFADPDGPLDKHRATIAAFAVDDGIVTVSEPLPAIPPAGLTFRVLGDEYMHKCHLDVRVNGSLMVFAESGGGASNFHYERTIEYGSHMHFFRRHHGNRWEAASAESCCQPNPAGAFRMIRQDPPPPLKLTRGQEVTYRFEGTTWPDLTGQKVTFHLFSIPNGLIVDADIIVSGDGENETVTQVVEVTISAEDSRKPRATVHLGQVIEPEQTEDSEGSGEPEEPKGNSTTEFLTNLTYTGTGRLVFTSGNMVGRARDVEVADGMVTTEWPLPSVPSPGSEVELIVERWDWLLQYRAENAPGAEGGTKRFASGTLIVYPDPDGEEDTSP